MVNIETNKIINLIPSRNLEDVNFWLKAFAHIEIVSQDESITFCDAITKAQPTTIQISKKLNGLHKKIFLAFASNFHTSYKFIEQSNESNSFISH